MANEVAKREQQQIRIADERLPYHPAFQERFGIGRAEWRALVESTFPAAKTTEAVLLALAYCKARGLDPFKKCVHIVPIWDAKQKKNIETVWPGIAEYRTTAARTGEYVGHDEVAHGPMIEQTWEDEDYDTKQKRPVTVRFPEWAQLTVYRMVQGVRCPFPGPKVWWLETYASKKNGTPNTMWSDRPIGMIDKCAEAAALRGAFPEELGGEVTAEEVGRFQWGASVVSEPPKAKTAAMLESPRIIDAKQDELTEEEQAETDEYIENESAAESYQPTDAITQDEAEYLDGVREFLPQCDTLLKVDQAEKATPAMGVAAKAKMHELCEQRRADIRGQRGEGSNR